MGTFIIIVEPVELIINNITIDMYQVTQKTINLSDYFESPGFNFHDFSKFSVTNIENNIEKLIFNNKIHYFTNLDYNYNKTTSEITFSSLNRYFTPQVVLKNCLLIYDKYSDQNKNFSSNLFDITINILCNPFLKCPPRPFPTTALLNNKSGSANSIYMKVASKIKNTSHYHGSKKTILIKRK